MKEPADTTASLPLSAATAKPGWSRANLLIAALVLVLVGAALVVRRRATAPGETTTGPATVTEAERPFVGRWNSTNTLGPGVGINIMKADNTYVAICKRGWIMDCDGEGTWSVRGQALVWIHDSNPSAEDVNPIVEFTPDRFVIREMNGKLTVFTRLP